MPHMKLRRWYYQSNLTLHMLSKVRHSLCCTKLMLHLNAVTKLISNFHFFREFKNIKMALFLHIFFKKMNSWFFFKKRFYLLNLNFLSENAYFAQIYIGEIFFLMKMHIFLTFIKHKIKMGIFFSWKCVLCLFCIFFKKSFYWA